MPEVLRPMLTWMEVNTPKKNSRTKRRGLWAALGVAVIVLGALGFVFSQGDATADAIITREAFEAAPNEFLSSVIGADSPASPPGAPFRHIVYNDGVLFVRGVTGSQENADELIAELQPIFGVDNVVSEILVVEGFQEDPNAPTSVFFSENVLFETGSSEIAPEFLHILGLSAAFLEISPDTTIEITGHTDNAGDEASNLLLSQARVDAARDAMIEQGGDPDRITAIGKGETEPIADNSTPEGRQLNRRVELQIN